MVIKRIIRAWTRRRSKGPTPQEPSPVRAPSRSAKAIRKPIGARTLIIWESELRAIAAESAAWTIETGGDLFGRWDAHPAVFLATKAGPNAQRSNAHFRLDVDYLRQLSAPLAAEWTLRYFGDWHSHHRLGLLEPSSGDRRRIRQLGNRNQFPGMAEIIVTTEGSQQQPIVRLHPWFYDLAVEGEPTAMAVRVIAGCSPIRQALIARGSLPEQDLRAWETVILQSEGFSQFSVYYQQAYDSYYASGLATSSSGKNYNLYMPIPSGFPTQRPPLYVLDPHPLLMANGASMATLGVSHAMHTLSPDAQGHVQICHWRDPRWHAGIVLQKVFLKALIWIEAYEQHLATGRNLADFVRTMAEAA